MPHLGAHVVAHTCRLVEHQESSSHCQAPAYEAYHAGSGTLFSAEHGLSLGQLQKNSCAM